MAETAEKPKRKKSEKQGLHGWKAAVAVFGCGTLAALAVFGLIVSVLGFVFNTASSGFEDQEASSPGAPEAIGDPQPSIEPGDLDMCNRNLEASGSVQLTRIGEEDNYEDTIDSDERVVSDACEWELTSEYDGTEKWNLTYTYDAYIETPEGDRVDVASADFDERVDQLSQDIAHIESEGESGLTERSHYFYGETSSGGTGYILLAQTRSAVYEIHIEAGREVNSGGLVPENPIYREVADLVRISEIEFELWIPGSDD